MVKKYNIGMRAKAVEIFTDIYRNPPFSFDWINNSNIKSYFEELEKNLGFVGFVFECNGNIEGVCFGKVTSHFQNSKFYINELFISRKMQRCGIGTEFIKAIGEELCKKGVYVMEINTDKKSYAYNFYKKINFVEVENNVTMIKALKRDK